MEPYTTKDFVKDYGYTAAVFTKLISKYKIKPVYKIKNKTNVYDKKQLTNILKKYEIEKNFKQNSKNYYSIHDFRNEYPYSDGTYHQLIQKYNPKPSIIIQKTPYYLKSNIQKILNELNQKLNLKNNYITLEEFSQKLNLTGNTMVGPLQRANVPIIKLEKPNAQKTHSYIQKDVAEKIINKYQEDRENYPLSRSQLLQTLKITNNVLNAVLTISNIKPHKLYLGSDEQYFSKNNLQIIKSKLKYANTNQIKKIQKQSINNEPKNIKVFEFCKKYQLNPHIIKNAIINNNQPYYKKSSHGIMYISTTTANWILKNHINNKPNNYISIKDLANQMNLKKQVVNSLVNNSIKDKQIKPTHRYINSVEAYLDPIQQQKIIKRYQNQYKIKKPKNFKVYKLKINTKKPFEPNNEFSCRDISNMLKLYDPNYIKRWAKSGKIEYQYDGKTIYFSKSQANKIKKDYKNYPIDPTQLITKTAAMEMLKTTDSYKFKKACNEFNIPIYTVLGDNRLLIKKSDINKLKPYYKQI